jgi:phospholipase D1/2
MLVTIYDGKNLETEERKSGKAPGFLRKLVETSEEVLKMGRGPSQYYATVDLGETRVGRTRVLAGSKDPKDPVWNEKFRIYCAHTVSHVVVSIKDAAIVGTTVVGRAKVPVIDLLSGEEVDKEYQLVNDHTGPLKRSRIRFSLQFFVASRDPYWGKGVLDSQNPGIPFCYFPQQKGCHVTLYQDAHMAENFLPPIYLSGDQVYQPQRCWEDIFEAINNAQKLIYITGWSVYTEITLCRDPQRPVPGDEGLTIGELLKKKADQGVRVNVMVWDDRSSFWLRQQGVMSTHDEATAQYFKGTNVKCFLCPRDADSNLTLMQKSQIGGLFTHHQKTVIVDAPLPGADAFSSGRRLVSFVGGLDLCDGRYDNQFHSLFRTLDTAHSRDFHQVFTGASVECGGPREPWHDIHSKLEGPVAWDVLSNFEERWKKQAGRPGDLLPIRDLGISRDPVTSEGDSETWNVQVFRSIDAGAAEGFPDTPEEAANKGLVSGKNISIDRSIHHAYINAIRRARNFIYIENQYFLGSSFGWETKKEAGAFNLIPMELVRKIVSKIEDGERFAVYVVIPMYPEGAPESQSVQAILDWQRRTFQMMYKEIAVALNARGIRDQHPREYLSVFCLGNRELRRADEYVPTKGAPPEDNYYRSAQEHRRFMIYVHSKMMIVDDEYIIVGSANINERSLNGARDSEIAMGAYQPHQLATHRPATGQIHGFRMALWYEHLGMLDNKFLQPWSVECIRHVNERSDYLWNLFAQEEVVDLPGHLMSYPYDVGSDGSLSYKPGCEFIPDTNAKVLGGTSYALPDILTT